MHRNWKRVHAMSDKTVQLTDPFPPEAIGALPKLTCPQCSKSPSKDCDNHKKTTCRKCGNWISTKHIHLDYVGHAHVTERLLQVDPKWTWEPVGTNNLGLPALDDNGGLWIRLSVGGASRLGYGDAAGKKGGNAVKEAIGDAIRNAAMRFGVALDLWKKETPAPTEDVPSREVEKPAQTDDERARELRGQIAAIARKRAVSIPDASAAFSEWSRGVDISAASVAVLAEYKHHLEREPS